VQAAALASAANDDAKQVTNSIDVIKKKHWNAFLTRTFDIDTRGNPVVVDLIVHSPDNKKGCIVKLIELYKDMVWVLSN
jgi:hypothetical protein